jgi:hypothetical protein
VYAVGCRGRAGVGEREASRTVEYIYALRPLISAGDRDMHSISTAAIIFCLTLSFTCGCLSDDDDDSDGKSLSYSISYTNYLEENVTGKVYLDGVKVDDFRADGAYSQGDVTGQGVGAFGTGPGDHVVTVETWYEDGSPALNGEESFSVQLDFDIEIEIRKGGIQIEIIEEEEPGGGEGNHAPTMEDGKYELLPNGTYRFTVIYRDSDGDAPTEARLIIFHSNVDDNGYNRSRDSSYNLAHAFGSYVDGAHYETYVEEFAGGDEYYFAFTDGYAIATPTDDTPYTDP